MINDESNVLELHGELEVTTSEENRYWSMLWLLAYAILFAYFYWKLRRLEKRSNTDHPDTIHKKRISFDTLGKTTLRIELTPEFGEVLRHLEDVTSDPLDEVLAKAITLYRVSVDAHAEGKRIGVLDENFELEKEVVGFDNPRSS